MVTVPVVLAVGGFWAVDAARCRGLCRGDCRRGGFHRLVGGHTGGDRSRRHRVALEEAWESGARHWSATDRRRFANDLGFGESLEAITDNVNSSKGDRDPAQCLPPLRANHCD
jgi:hypothetical protein